MEYVKIGNHKSERPRTRNYNLLVSYGAGKREVGRKNYSFHAASALCKDLWICGSVDLRICIDGDLCAGHNKPRTAGAHKLKN